MVSERDRERKIRRRVRLGVAAERRAVVGKGRGRDGGGCGGEKQGKVGEEILGSNGVWSKRD